MDSVLPFLQTNSHFTCSVLSGGRMCTHYFFLACLQSTSNPLKVVLLIPSREHLVKELSFPVVTQTALIVVITEIHPTVD
jgi:hypothetical protein